MLPKLVVSGSLNQHITSTWLSLPLFHHMPSWPARASAILNSKLCSQNYLPKAMSDPLTYLLTNLWWLSTAFWMKFEIDRVAFKVIHNVVCAKYSLDCTPCSRETCTGTLQGYTLWSHPFFKATSDAVSSRKLSLPASLNSSNSTHKAPYSSFTAWINFTKVIYLHILLVIEEYKFHEEKENGENLRNTFSSLPMPFLQC